MKKLLKIKQNHFVIVDDLLSLSEGDIVGCLSTHYNNADHSEDTQINHIRTWSEKDTCELCFKITHSTEPLSENCKKCNSFCDDCSEQTKPIELEDVLKIIKKEPSFIESRIEELTRLANFASMSKNYTEEHFLITQIQHWRKALENDKEKYNLEDSWDVCFDNNGKIKLAFNK